MDIKIEHYLDTGYEVLLVDGEPVMGRPFGLSGLDILLWHKYSGPDNGISYEIDYLDPDGNKMN